MVKSNEIKVFIPGEEHFLPVPNNITVQMISLDKSYRDKNDLYLIMEIIYQILDKNYPANKQRILRCNETFLLETNGTLTKNELYDVVKYGVKLLENYINQFSMMSKKPKTVIEPIPKEKIENILLAILNLFLISSN
jgi:hypothetical protein